eukprot:SAG11_NODE_29722_length_308_cov_0.478469_2_plen_30_part_01
MVGENTHNGKRVMTRDTKFISEADTVVRAD